jgi:hypothetical protein
VGSPELKTQQHTHTQKKYPPLLQNAVAISYSKSDYLEKDVKFIQYGKEE